MFTHTPSEHLWYQTFHSIWDKAISKVKSKMFPNGVLVVCIGSVTSCSGYLCFPKQGKVGALLNLDAWVFAFSDSCFVNPPCNNPTQSWVRWAAAVTNPIQCSALVHSSLHQQVTQQKCRYTTSSEEYITFSEIDFTKDMQSWVDKNLE